MSAKVAVAWGTPQDGRVVAWLYVGGDVCTPLTMTEDQAWIVHEALESGTLEQRGWQRVAR